MPATMCGIGSEPAESIPTCARAGRPDRRADRDHAEVEGPDVGGVDRDHRERLAVIRAGQVQAAGRVREVGAEPVAGDRVSDFAGRGAGGVFGLFEPGLELGRRDRGLRAVRDAGDLAEQTRRQFGGVGGELLVGVTAVELQVERGVGAGLAVQRPRLGRRRERRDPRGTFRPAYAFGELEGRVDRVRWSRARKSRRGRSCRRRTWTALPAGFAGRRGSGR